MRKLSAAVLRTQPDATLAALAGGGSEAAFEAIVHRHRRALLAYCRRLLLSDNRSEDVVQQAFVDAWSALRAGTEVRETRAWLYRITHNQAMRALRLPEYDFDALGEVLRGADAPESDLERRMLVREALAAVAALPEQQQEAILRTAVDGQSYEQVAVALGVSDGAVRGLVYRARASLRAALAAAAPPPLVLWAAASTRRGAPLAQWIADVLGAGGSSDSAAIALKSITVLATSAVVVSGTLGGAIDHVDRALTSAHRGAPAPHRAHRTRRVPLRDVEPVASRRFAPAPIANVGRARAPGVVGASGTPPRTDRIAPSRSPRAGRAAPPARELGRSARGAQPTGRQPGDARTAETRPTTGAPPAGSGPSAVAGTSPLSSATPP